MAAERSAACSHDPAQFVTAAEGTSYCPVCEEEARPSVARWRVYPYDRDALLHPTDETLDVDAALTETRRLLEAGALRVEIVAAETE